MLWFCACWIAKGLKVVTLSLFDIDKLLNERGGNCWCLKWLKKPTVYLPSQELYFSPRIQSISLCSLLADFPYSSTSRCFLSVTFSPYNFTVQAKAQNASQLCKNKVRTPKYAFRVIMQPICNHLSCVIVATLSNIIL